MAQIAENAAAISAIVAALALAFGAIRFALEYRKQNALKRFEKFQEMRKSGRDDVLISEVIDCLRDYERQQPGAAERLRDTDIKRKHRFLSFFEEIAIMHDSGLIKTNVAHYMFGYFCILCWDTTEFWVGIEKRSYYWSLFARFAALMKEIEAKRLEDHRHHLNRKSEVDGIARLLGRVATVRPQWPSLTESESRRLWP